MPIEWPVTCPSAYPRSVKPRETARWTSWRSRLAASRRAPQRGTRRRPRASLGSTSAFGGRSRARPRPSACPGPRPRATAARSRRAPSPAARSRTPAPDEHHVHRQPAAALARRRPARRSHHLARRTAGLVGRRETPRSPRSLIRTLSRTDSSSASLFTARARSNSLVERHGLESLQRPEVAHGHHIVEPVDADAAPAGLACARWRSARRAGVEDLLDPCRAVLADVASLGREDDERLAVGRHDHVGVAVHDLEAGEVRDGALEPGVLAARDDERVQVVLGHRRANVGVAAL